MNIAVTKSKQEHRKPDLVCSKNSEVWAGFSMSVPSEVTRLNSKCEKQYKFQLKTEEHERFSNINHYDFIDDNRIVNENSNPVSLFDRNEKALNSNNINKKDESQIFHDHSIDVDTDVVNTTREANIKARKDKFLNNNIYIVQHGLNWTSIITRKRKLTPLD